MKVWSAVDLSHIDTQDGTRSFNRLAKLSDDSVLAVGDDGQLSKWILNTN